MEAQRPKGKVLYAWKSLPYMKISEVDHPSLVSNTKGISAKGYHCAGQLLAQLTGEALWPPNIALKPELLPAVYKWTKCELQSG